MKLVNSYRVMPIMRITPSEMHLKGDKSQKEHKPKAKDKNKTTGFSDVFNEVIDKTK